MAVSMEMIINQKKKRTKAMVEKMDKRQMKNRIIAGIMDTMIGQMKRKKAMVENMDKRQMKNRIIADIMDMMIR